MMGVAGPSELSASIGVVHQGSDSETCTCTRFPYGTSTTHGNARFSRAGRQAHRGMLLTSNASSRDRLMKPGRRLAAELSSVPRLVLKHRCRRCWSGASSGARSLVAGGILVTSPLQRLGSSSVGYRSKVRPFFRTPTSGQARTLPPNAYLKTLSQEALNLDALPRALIALCNPTRSTFSRKRRISSNAPSSHRSVPWRARAPLRAMKISLQGSASGFV